ncbi:glycosyltransferase [Hymenobacter sp. UYP22]|uniref:glycosyltransferase n=1 Tax=Hymenobacter sp. UYP22 TaxID=3156348 RepID=UPI0033948FC8
MVVKQAAGVAQMRLLVVLGLVSLAYFVVWFSTADPIGYAPLFWLLTISLGFKLLRALHEWYHYVSVTEPVPPAGQLPLFSVDILTTACPGEPHAMIVHTLEAMQAITYPHTSYLCDEGDDPYLRAACERLGVVHVTRKLKVDAKAGNINNALRQATGELCVVLDPDHVPAPDFLDHVVPYFTNSQVGYVQVVQAYGNQDDSLVALGAAEQTYHFYGPLMMGMNTYNTTQAIGANCTFRRAALNSIGGHAAGLTEDMHTAMRLHAAGWQSVYVPRVLSRGLVPSTLGAFYAQQLKWARGAFELLFTVFPHLVSRFSWRQRLHYLTLPLYFLSGLVTLIDLAVPIASLVLSVYPWHISLPDFALHLAPLLGISLLIRLKAQQWLREPHEAGLHLAGGILRVGSWWIYLLGLVYTVLRVRVPYIPTPKEGNTRNEWRISVPNILAVMLCAAAVKYAGYVDWSPYSRLMAFLATCNAAILTLAVGMGQHTWVRTLVADFQERPLADLMQAGRRVVAGATTQAQTLGAALAMSSLLMVGGIDVTAYAVRESGEFASAAWLLDGGTKLRLGVQQSYPSLVLPVKLSPFSTYSALPSQAPDVVGLPLLGKVPLETITALQRQGVTPLLNWTVPSSAADWQPMISALSELKKPVLLRPVLSSSSPATFRQDWKALVQKFRAAGLNHVVWVWTPPRAAALPAYFPGEECVDWVAAPYAGGTDEEEAHAPSYAAYRHQFATCIALHQKPVMLLSTAASPSNNQLARQIRQRYPEVKAIIFQPRSRARSIPLLTSRKQYTQVALNSN